MPAINATMLVMQEKQQLPVLFSNSGSANDAIEASKSPVGTNVQYADADWFGNVSITTRFAFFLPDGMTLNKIATYNEVSDKWQEMNWQEVPKDSNYNNMHYYIDHTLLDGYAAYVFEERDADGDPVTRSFPIGISVE